MGTAPVIARGASAVAERREPARPPLFALVERVTAPDSPWKPTERLVALALGHHLGRDGTAFPSLARLAGWTGLSRHSVQRAVAALCGPDGLFERVPGGARKGDRYSTSHYRLRGVPVASLRGATQAPLEAQGVPHSSMRGATVAPGTTQLTAQRKTEPTSGVSVAPLNGHRAAVEAECRELVAEVVRLTGASPAAVVKLASAWTDREGRERFALSVEELSDKALLHTRTDLVALRDDALGEAGRA